MTRLRARNGTPLDERLQMRTRIAKRRSWTNAQGIRKRCLEWTGAIHHRKGCGIIHAAGRARLAHRVVYEIDHGPIPDGMCVAQLCMNARCIRSDHLGLRSRSDVNAESLKKRLKLRPLKRAQVRAIRADPRRYRIIAAQHGISTSAVCKCKVGDSYRDFGGRTAFRHRSAPARRTEAAGRPKYQV